LDFLATRQLRVAGATTAPEGKKVQLGPKRCSEEQKGRGWVYTDQNLGTKTEIPDNYLNPTIEHCIQV